MKIHTLLVALLLPVLLLSQQPVKREFRGAWIHTVGNQQFKTMSTDSIKAMLIKTLDILEEAGVNAVIFQVRPQADALYVSNHEPWSRFITGQQGKAPNPLWDPLQFMIEESHQRGMELHAWCNPYRVTSNEQEQLHPSHLYFKKPYLFKRYGKQLYFDPGEPEAVEHTVKVIADIVERYDVDAIHFDDYFYPYPIQFEEFHDDHSFVKYAYDQGYEYWQKSDWRRNNVSTLIKALNDTIKSIKPWVRFGISPFGIHRNLKDTPDGSGSKTNGLS
ncbi:MAG: family 10 glycosylhydrolase, partial [Bacteroidales bacterium]|nr:family 10 glycosylhydrolase [Bacteroidales bacterium]